MYRKAETAINGADGGGIIKRWEYGLRMLADPEVVTGSGKSLQHGKAARLIADAEAHGLNLSERELRRRLQCARAYPQRAQIGQAAADFGTWTALADAGFPPYPVVPDEPPADVRTQEEIDRDRYQLLLMEFGEQGQLFPFEMFEPTETTLKDLFNYRDSRSRYAKNIEDMVARMTAYLDTLMAAVGDDMETTWAAAHRAAYGDDPV
jgi:hypothetical protein